MTLEVFLVDIIIEVHDISIINENSADVDVETSRVFHNFVHYIGGRKGLIDKIKRFLLR